MKYSLIQFMDNSRRLKALVLTKDVKGFEPRCAEDVSNKEYLVKYQDSFHGKDEEYHDGCYPGQVLIVGGKQIKLYRACCQILCFDVNHIAFIVRQQLLTKYGRRLKN